MDQSKKRNPLDGQLGRMMRNMAMQQRLVPLHSGEWTATADIYETDTDLIVVMDVSGVEPADLSVVAEEMKVRVSGERNYSLPEKISSVHQLEIERGYFERAVTLPLPIDISRTTSVYKNGILVITLPLKPHRGKVQIKVT